nr:MAG: hypothetical protein [Molluscum contagiosum virus]
MSRTRTGSRRRCSSEPAQLNFCRSVQLLKSSGKSITVSCAAKCPGHELRRASSFTRFAEIRYCAGT